MRQIRLWAAPAAVVLGLCGCAVNASNPMPIEKPSTVVRVYSAGSLREALTQVAKNYEERTGQKIELTFGASGLLRERIEKGEVADVFASADTDHPRRLAAGGKWQDHTVFVRNGLCALTSDKLQSTPSSMLKLMLSPEVRVGTSTPKADPAGDYAWTLFRKADTLQAGAYQTLDEKALKLTGGVDSPKPPPGKSTYAWVMDQGQADLFLTYCTNAVAAQREVPRLQVVQLPSNLQVSAAYGVTVRANAAASAKLFADALTQSAAQEVFTRYGFGRP
jgi:molybdate transport system substrate-binding protein